MRAGALALLAGVAALALWLAHQVDIPVFFPPGVWGIGKTCGVGAAFFALCGYGPARLLLDERLRARLWLYSLPVGAACATLTLTLLGLLHVPFDVSLPAVMVAGAALAVIAVRRVPRIAAPPSAAGGLTAHLVVPLALGALIMAVACLPAIHAGFPTVQGQNPDAMMVSGTATLLQHAPPTAVRPELGLDKVPLLWRSKLPIYYALAAVARLGGQNPVNAFTGVAALALALAALGFFLLAFDGLGAPVLAGLGAMVVVGLSRIVTHLAYGPFYNQLWALTALPFALLFGWQFLRAPDRRSATLAALFAALALFTYPLLLPFPLVFFAVVAWRRRHERGWWRALRLPAARSAGVRYVVIAALAIPVTAVLVRGIWEKLIPAARALAPGGDLTGWSGNGIIPYFPFGWFFGVSVSSALAAVLVVAIFVAALIGLWRVRGDAAVALAVLLVGALLAGVYLRARGDGELFYFRDLGFAGPLIAMLAVIGLASLRPRVLAVAAVAAYVVAAGQSTRIEAVGTYEQTPYYLFDLRTWDREIPADQSIRLDVPPSGWQLWSWYFLARHRVSAPDPERGPFPHPPIGTKADLALVYKPGKRPPDAVGPPIRENLGFTLYRLRPDLPGTDVSSRALLYDISKVTF